MERVLTQSGLTTVTAASGHEGWEAFQRQSFSLVISDWVMPDGTGEWLVENILVSESKVPVVILTSEPEANCLKSEWKEKNVHYMQKPFIAPQLIDLVRRLALPS